MTHGTHKVVCHVNGSYVVYTNASHPSGHSCPRNLESICWGVVQNTVVRMLRRIQDICVHVTENETMAMCRKQVRMEIYDNWGGSIATTIATLTVT